MRIAYLSTEFPPKIYGGLGVYVDFISRALTALGNRVTVFTLGYEGLELHEDLGGVEVFRETPLPMGDGLEPFLSKETLDWGSGLKFLFELMSYNQLSAADIRVLNRFDICVAHDWLGLPGGMAAKRAGFPLIYHVHGTEAGRSVHPNPQLVHLEKRGGEVADCVITVSNAMKDELIGLGFPADKIRVCYHGVDARFFDPARLDPKRLADLRAGYGFGPDDTVILFIGRLEPVKGVIQLIEAMPAVLEKHPGARLLIVGRGTLEDRVRSMAGGSKHLILNTDFLDDESKAYTYALADLCVFPSLYEPFGIVGLEAASMARPAVVGAAGTSGLREIVENPASKKPTGVHVNPRSPQDIAWGINLALEDPERLKDWGRNARERVLNLFTWERAAELTMDIYREVAGSRS
ncbi:MAG TPA: glycosyltransferase family 4 protein [Methanotrichaceae archaeon]|nr:glycosyltransferase family 4 protein [Methanotrichaceae archaeon]